MANIKVSELSETTTFNDDDYTMIVQNNENKKISKENMLNDIYEKVNDIDSKRIKDMIQAGVSSNTIPIAANSLTQIPFDTLTQSIGTNLTLNNNKIVVGGQNLSGKIKLTFYAYGTSTTTLNYCYAYIYKNSVETADMYAGGAGTSNRFNLIQDVVLDYQSGDEFSVSYGSQTPTILSGSYFRTLFRAEILTYE